MESSPSHPASLPGASIRPSTRTSSGKAGDSSSIRASRKVSRRSATMRRSFARTVKIAQAAARVQTASSRPTSTKAVWVRIMAAGLCGGARHDKRGVGKTGGMGMQIRPVRPQAAVTAGANEKGRSMRPALSAVTSAQ